MNIDTKRLIRLLELKDNDILALEQRVLKLINEVKKVNKMKVKFKKCHEDAVIPKYAHNTDSGMDIFAIENHNLYSSNTVKVRTGLKMILPVGYEAQVRPKSGLSLQGLHIHFGTIDNGYEGEIMVNACCLNNREYVIKKGEKIAQIVIQKIENFEVEEVFEIENKSSRGEGGFGSTGLILEGTK